jgi:hypothetical protein
LKPLKGYPLEIIKSKNRKAYLYHDICKIDSSFNYYRTIIEYDSLLSKMPIEYFDRDIRMELK